MTYRSEGGVKIPLDSLQEVLGPQWVHVNRDRPTAVRLLTDAPLLPHQSNRITTRVALGAGRSGGMGGNSSGDIFVAFSTANPRVTTTETMTGADGARVEALPHNRLLSALRKYGRLKQRCARAPVE